MTKEAIGPPDEIFTFSVGLTADGPLFDGEGLTSASLVITRLELALTLTIDCRDTWLTGADLAAVATAGVSAEITVKTDPTVLIFLTEGEVWVIRAALRA